MNWYLQWEGHATDEPVWFRFLSEEYEPTGNRLFLSGKLFNSPYEIISLVMRK